VCHSGPSAGSTDLLISVTRESQNIVHTMYLENWKGDNAMREMTKNINPYFFYFFFLQILTAFNKLKIMSEVVHDK